jgi:hypothetical protein
VYGFDFKWESNRDGAVFANAHDGRCTDGQKSTGKTPSADDTESTDGLRCTEVDIPNVLVRKWIISSVRML